jgi:hypothetical protein
MRAICQFRADRPHRLATSRAGELAERQGDQKHKDRQARQRQSQRPGLQTVHPRWKYDQERVVLILSIFIFPHGNSEGIAIHPSAISPSSSKRNSQ